MPIVALALALIAGAVPSSRPAGAEPSISLLQTVAASCPTAQNAGLPPNDEIAQMRCAINAVRANYGLPTLRASGKLDRAALLKADGIRRCGFTHSPCGEPWILPFKQVGYLSHAAAVGENLAWGSAQQGSPAATVSHWLASPPHRRNLLARTFRDAGLACEQGSMFNNGNVTLWVLDFGRRR